MKYADLIIVYKICVRGLSEKDVKRCIQNIEDNIVIKSNDNLKIIHYIVPVHKEYEHPIDVINPNNIKNEAVEKLLEDLLTELTFKDI